MDFMEKLAQEAYLNELVKQAYLENIYRDYLEKSALSKRQMAMLIGGGLGALGSGGLAYSLGYAPEEIALASLLGGTGMAGLGGLMFG